MLNGYIVCVFSMVLMASFAVVTKFWIVSPLIICITTSVLFTIFSVILWRGKGPFLSFKLPVLIDGTCELIDFVGRILCVRFLPVSLAMAINASTPIYGVIIEYFIDPNRFSTKMKLKRLGCVILICISIAVQSFGSLSGDDQESQSMSSIILGVSLAVISAVARVITNFAVEESDESIRIHHFLMGNVFCYMLLPVIIPFIMPVHSADLNLPSWEKGSIIGLLFLVSSVAVIMTFTFHDIAVTTALAIRTLEIPTVYFIGTIFLNEPANLYSFLGCASVTVWCLVMVVFLSSEEIQTKITDKESELNERMPLLTDKAGSSLVSVTTTSSIHGGNFTALALRMRFEMNLHDLLLISSPGTLFRTLDMDGSGGLDQEELFSKIGEIEQETYRMDIFKDIDKDGNGEIDEKEFQEVCARVSSEFEIPTIKPKLKGGASDENYSIGV